MVRRWICSTPCLTTWIHYQDLCGGKRELTWELSSNLHVCIIVHVCSQRPPINKRSIFLMLTKILKLENYMEKRLKIIYTKNGWLKIQNAAGSGGFNPSRGGWLSSSRPAWSRMARTLTQRTEKPCLETPTPLISRCLHNFRTLSFIK